ncbi:MAG: hypothetical protein KDA38_14765, partial [Planctomycetales bacterium]|nr:hypothetical protein [Planctomycetales bacterium]
MNDSYTDEIDDSESRCGCRRIGDKAVGVYGEMPRTTSTNCRAKLVMRSKSPLATACDSTSDPPMPRAQAPALRNDSAVSTVTPPVGIYHRMWGAATHDQAAGVHRPLLATAMIFAPLTATEPSPSPESLQVVITLDHCLMGQREIQQLRQRVLAAVQVPIESLLVLFSHTHAAGMMTHDRVEMPGGELIPGYLERLNTTVAELVQQALSALRPATIQYAQGRCDLAAQRDFWDDQRRMFVCGYHPGAAADDTVIAARAVADDGQTLATIVNYACHPTTLAWENQLI